MGIFVSCGNTAINYHKSNPSVNFRLSCLSTFRDSAVQDDIDEKAEAIASTLQKRLCKPDRF